MIRLKENLFRYDFKIVGFMNGGAAVVFEQHVTMVGMCQGSCDNPQVPVSFSFFSLFKFLLSLLLLNNFVYIILHFVYINMELDQIILSYPN